MNLSELETRVGDQLQYAPDLLAYERDIRRVLSEVHRELCTERPWPFLFTTAQLPVFPDITIPNAQIALLGGSETTLAINATNLEDVLYPATESRAYELWQNKLIGAEFDLVDRDNLEAGAGNWVFGPFIIDNVLPSVDNQVALYMDERFRVSLLVEGLGDYIIRWRRYQLPPDCDQLLAIIDDNDRPLTMLPQGLWREFMQDPDRSGSGPCYILPDGGFDTAGPTFQQGPGSLVGVTDLIAGSAAVRQVRNHPVYEDPPFVMTAAAGGSLLASTTYRAFCSWVYGGRYGPASQIVSVATTGGNKTINVTALPQKTTAAGADGEGDTGHRLAIFLSEGDHGPFVEHSILSTGFGTTATISTRPYLTKVQTTANRLRRWDEVYPQGPYQYVRLWPRPAETATFRIEYLRRPRQLIADVDEPELPEAFHRLLVHRTVLEMGARFNAGAAIMQAHQKMADKALQALYNRYLPQMAMTKQKGLLGATTGFGARHPTTLDVQ